MSVNYELDPQIVELPVEEIRVGVNIKNIRTTIDEKGILELAQSIHADGQLVPIVVMIAEDEDGSPICELVCGARRLRDVAAGAPEHGADDGCSGVRVRRGIRRSIVFARPPRRFQTLERVHATRRARQYSLPRRREHPPRLRVRVKVPALAAQTYPQPHRDTNPLPRRQRC